MLNSLKGEFRHPLQLKALIFAKLQLHAEDTLGSQKKKEKNHVHLQNKSSSSSISRWKTPKSEITHFSGMPNNKKLELEDSSQ